MICRRVVGVGRRSIEPFLRLWCIGIGIGKSTGSCPPSCPPSCPISVGGACWRRPRWGPRKYLREGNCCLPLASSTTPIGSTPLQPRRGGGYRDRAPLGHGHFLSDMPEGGMTPLSILRALSIAADMRLDSRVVQLSLPDGHATPHAYWDSSDSFAAELLALFG